jgi:hypothetical protein
VPPQFTLGTGSLRSILHEFLRESHSPSIRTIKLLAVSQPKNKKVPPEIPLAPADRSTHQASINRLEALLSQRLHKKYYTLFQPTLKY